MTRTSRTAWILIVLVLVARGAAVWRAGPPLLESDSGAYHDIATHLAAGDGYAFSPSHQFPWMRDALGSPHPTALRSPGYPVFLSLFYRAGLGPFGASAANAVLAALTAWLMYRLSRRIGLDDRAACIAIGAYLLYPPFNLYAAQLMTENLFIPLLLAGMLMVVRALDRGSLAEAAGAGLALGLAALTRPVAYLLPLALAPVLWRRGGRSTVGIWAMPALAFGLAVAPWVVRNELVFGRFEPSFASSGHNLFMGTYPPTLGRPLIPNEERPVEIMAEIEGRDEFGVDSLYRAAARRNLREHPLEQIPLAASKVVRSWFNVPDGHMFLPTVRSLIVNGPLLLLGMLGCYGLWRRGAPHAWVPVFIILYSTLAHAATIASVRFNLFAWVFVFMGVGEWIGERWPRGRTVAR